MDTPIDRTAHILAIDKLRSRDLAPDAAPPATDHTAWILRLVLLLCIIVFAGSAFYTGTALYRYYTADSLYGDIADSYLTLSNVNPLPSPADPFSVGEPLPGFGQLFDMSDGEKNQLGGSTIDISPELLRMRRVLAALKLKNADTFGWVTVGGTRIDYPVVQASNNDYYLDHAFTGVFLEAGAIYADYRNGADPATNKNTILYGHNMKNGSMFHDLQSYFDGTGDFLRAHQDIVLATNDGIYTYRIFALYRADADENYIRTQFGTHAQYAEFQAKLCDRTDPLYRALCDTPSSDAVMLTLSTCTNRTETDERYAIHAYLVNVEK